MYCSCCGPVVSFIDGDMAFLDVLQLPHGDWLCAGPVFLQAAGHGSPGAWGGQRSTGQLLEQGEHPAQIHAHVQMLLVCGWQDLLSCKVFCTVSYIQALRLAEHSMQGS